MKHWMSLMMILLLVVGLCIPAGAEDDTTYTDMSTATFDVNYTVPDGQDWTKRPTARFNFTIEADGEQAEQSGVPYPSDPPRISVADVNDTEIEKGESGKTLRVTITLPEYTNVGVYKYTISQTDPKISGVTCHKEDIHLTVQVIWDETEKQVRVAAVHCEAEGSEKSDEITNTYHSGSLAITKKATGNMGDQEQYFDVTVKLTAPAETTPSTDSKVAISTGSATNPDNATTMDYGDPGTTIRIKNSETITLSNIAAGTTYTVTEADYTTEGEEGKGYDVPVYTFSDDTNKRIDSGDADTVKIVNNKGVPVDTGISLDNAPYLLLLAVVLVAGTVLVLKRRHREKD